MKLLLLIAFFVAAWVPPAAPADRKWFIFLVKGPTKPGTPAEVEAMQRAHIANFQRLFKEGKLFMAGPLQDPSTVKRGILGVIAPDRETLLRYFEPDPYVMSGIMAVDAQEWEVDLKRIASEFIDPDKIAEHRFALLKAIRPIPPSVLRQHAKYVSETLRPDLEGKLLRNSSFEQIMFFKSTDGPKIQRALDLDPLVRHGYVALELMPLWMSPETIR